VGTDDEASSPARDELFRVRHEMEVLDRTLVELLAERVRLARVVGDAKRELGLCMADAAQEAEVVRRAAVAARETGMDDEEVRCIFWRLIGVCRRAQLEERGAGCRPAVAADR
jgi:chorismate mutase